MYPPEDEGPQRGYTVYARVSSRDQKHDVDRQVRRGCDALARRGFQVGKIGAEVGSGLNGHRRKLGGLLRDRQIDGIAGEHKDRLARFGAESLEAAREASGRKLFVVDPQELTDDLVQDMIDGLTRFCARLYGRRSARHRAERAIKAVAE